MCVLLNNITTCLILLLISTTIVLSTLVEDYVKLFNYENKKALKFQLPKNNMAIYRDIPKASVTELGTFDFIVVGAGSAGAVLATRLSESKFDTLLLEAGDSESNFTTIPGVAKLLQRSKYNWGYYTSPQQHICQAMIDRTCPVTRGRSLGGTSSINYMVYSRSNEADHKLWSNLGITGWTWRDVLPYYKRLENYDNLILDPGYHGFNGSVPIDISRPSNYLIDIFLDANRQLYKLTDDYNGRNYMGSSKTQFSRLYNGTRASTGVCYLSNINTHLTISKNSFVYKVLVNQNDTVYGVEFFKNFRKFVAYSKFEVIISAGAISTPQLLMLSGIGPKEELAKHNITLIKDLPVGQNTQDHVAFFGLQFESNLNLSFGNITLEQNIWEYLQFGTGPLTDLGLQALTFMSTINDTNYPDINILLSPTKDSVFSVFNDSVTSTANLNSLFSIAIMFLHPKSKGSIKLASNNYESFPIIDPNSLSVTDDVERIYQAIQYVSKLLETEPFKKINASIVTAILPECNLSDYLSKEFWYCTIKQLSTSLHTTGSCAMGNDTRSSVVDDKLRVHGIKNLRIADLSVVPKSPSCHTNALAMMIGEKAADILKQSYFQGHTVTTVAPLMLLLIVVSIFAGSFIYKGR